MDNGDRALAALVADLAKEVASLRVAVRGGGVAAGEKVVVGEGAGGGGVSQVEVSSAKVIAVCPEATVSVEPVVVGASLERKEKAWDESDGSDSGEVSITGNFCSEGGASNEESGGTEPLAFGSGKLESVQAASSAFGGAVLEPRVPALSGQGDFFKSYVKTDSVRAFKKFLEGFVGFVIPKAALGEVALSMYTAATVPSAFTDGRARLKGLAAVGDGALALTYVNAQFGKGTPVASMQEAMNREMPSIKLAQAARGSGLLDHVVFGAGVDPYSRTGGEAVEAIAGVLFRWRTAAALVNFMRKLGFDV